jgi:hypothetical protein
VVDLHPELSGAGCVKQRGGDPTDPDQVIPVATDQNVIIVVDALQKFFKDPIRLGTLRVVGGRYDLANQVVTLIPTT